MLSTEIINQRRNCITASEAHRIMAGWDNPRPSDDFPIQIYDWIDEHKTKPLVGLLKSEGVYEKATSALIAAAWAAYKYDNPTPPQGLITYAEELACDELFEPDPNEPELSTWHMENGNEREEEAVAKLIEATGIKFVNTGDDQKHISVDGVGVTPDGIAYDDLDLISDGAEVKARSALHHARQSLIKDNATLIELDFKRFCQIQVGYHVTGAERWFSASYNPLATVAGLDFNYCLIERDNAFIEIFKKRAALTFEIRDQFKQALLSNVEAA